MFEGLGLGSRLASLKLPVRYNYVAICAAVLYGLTTPIGIAVGLGVRQTYNPDSTTASIVSGVLDSLSAGILIYTGLVEVGYFSPKTRMMSIDWWCASATAPRTRIPVQQRDAKRIKCKARICSELYASRLWCHGSIGPVGVDHRSCCCTVYDLCFHSLGSSM